MSDFYLTLPSNSSMHVYVDNSMANFKTKLPNHIELEGPWEVALVEMQYPHSWYNIEGVEGEIVVLTFPQGDGGMVIQQHVVNIPPGYYPTINNLLRRIETEVRIAVNVLENPISFRYDEITRKITANVQTGTSVSFKPGGKIQRILGFYLEVLPPGESEASLVVDMDPLHSLYVYCDLLEPRVVGDRMTQLLRIVPATGESGEMVMRIYENGHYTPLQRKSFETVEIDIRDSTGKKVPFERGTLNVTLHFRRRQPRL